MPNINYLKNRFTAGEISPLLAGRSDLATYANGAETLTNFVVQKTGGVTRRAGTRYVAEGAATTSRLIPFVYDTEIAYVLEFSNNNIRVYKDSAPVMDGLLNVDITTTYTTAELWELSYVQDGDILYIAHPAHPPAQLIRTSDAEWALADIPFDTPAFDEFGEVPLTILTLSNKTVGTGRTAVGTETCFLVGDVGRTITMADGALATITAYTDAFTVTVDILVEFASTTIASGDWTLTGSPQTTLAPNVKEPVGARIVLTAGDNAWKNNARYSHIGKWVSVNGGVAIITQIISSQTAYGKILKRLDSTTTAGIGAWSVNEAAWTADLGYPKAVGVFEQRLLLAGSTTYPRTVWGSRIADFTNFAIGTADDDAFSFTIPIDKGGTIQHLVSARTLYVLTYGGEITISGGADKGLTPTNVQIRQQTSHGSTTPRPLRIGNDVYFVQRAGKRLRTTGYKSDFDPYTSQDITLLSSHLTEVGIKEIVYSQEPDSRIFALLNDGTVAICTYDKEQQVLGWTRVTTDGTVDSITTIPYNHYDQIWLAVTRSIGGVDARCVEVMDDTLNTDSAYTGTHAGKATWTGLDHLEGETVDIVADGVSMTPQVVASGSVTLPRTAKAVEFGRHYASTLRDLPLDIATANGTAFGENISVNDIVVRLYNTTGLTVNGEDLSFRTLDADPLDEATPPFTGDKRMLNTTGWNDAGVVTIEQNQPLPCTILAVIKKVTVNYG